MQFALDSPRFCRKLWLMPYPKTVSARRLPRDGFALVIALALMSFVLLLLLTISSFVRVESSLSQTTLTRLEARQNALLGLRVAMGELQAVAGHDQRSVARADLMSQHPGVGVPSAAIPSASEDARRYWVGVSHSDGNSNFGPGGKPVQWLVSGLDRNRTAAQNLIDPLTDPVVLIGEHSVETDGQISAGKVPIFGELGLTGTFAWIIDDETLKAKLAPSNPAVDNENPASPLLASQRHVLPGYYNLEETTGLITSLGTLSRTTNLKNLNIENAANSLVVRERFYDYTLTGFGVLADSRNGGLKRDLTAAYENSAAFDNLFPEKSTPYSNASSVDNSYIVMDEEKFKSPDASDLRNNGYIHHGIFRDYYTLKDRVVNNSLKMTVIAKDLFNNLAPSDATRLGNVGPHAFSEGGHPYGDFATWDGDGSSTTAGGGGSHNPVTPVLAYLQQNAWIQAQQSPYNGEIDPQFDNRTQVWAGVYNPFNVGVTMSAGGSAGPMFRGFPQSRIYVFDGDDQSLVGWDSPTDGNFNGFLLRPIRWLFAKDSGVLTLAPGRTQVFGFSRDVEVRETEGSRNSTYSKNIKNSVQFASYRNGRVIKTEPDPMDPSNHVLPSLDVLTEFPLFDDGRFGGDWNGASISWGLPFDQSSSNPQGQAGFEIAQNFYTPFYTDIITDGVDIIEVSGGATVDVDKSNRPGSSRLLVNTPGVQFYREDVPFVANRMGAADEAFYRFNLRTTNDGSPSIRPLIDGNIRAIWNNPKWDNNFTLNTLATYTLLTNKTNPTDPLMIGQPDGSTDEAFLSYGDSILDSGSERVILFDVPREPLVSLGQLQHAAAGRFSYEPTYIVGNSYANVRISLDEWVESNAVDNYATEFNVSGRALSITGNFNLYDASYLVNEALFDSYTFTTIPQNSQNPQFGVPLGSFLDQTALLQNPRYLAYEPSELAFDEATLRSDTSGRTNAGFVLSDGAFNVNSTSVKAWEAFLSGTKGLPFRQMGNAGEFVSFEPVDEVRFPRVQTILGEPWEGSPTAENYWVGFRGLTSDEVRDLAQGIVTLIRERGPFHSLAEFINRNLNGSTPLEQQSGLLQTALDAVINTGIPAGIGQSASGFPQIPSGSNQATGFTSFLLQGDILQVLAPFMQTRSDTFKIRSYGESLDPTSGDIVGRVWCEAVVQRVTDAVADSSGGTILQELESPTSSFGRQFKVISFRWLDEDEV